MDNIQVMVRARPCTKKSKQGSLVASSEKGTVDVAGHTFRFDTVLGPKSSQDDVWAAVKPGVQRALEGYSVTVFAYGQTGSGKTHTMLDGIAPRVIDLIYDSATPDSLVSITCMEIYEEKVFDLSDGSPKRKALPVVNFEVPGIKSRSFADRDDMIKYLKGSSSSRTTRATEKNDVSSRSHAVFTITMDRQGFTCRVRLVDLAGSERAQGVPTETKAINTSLTYLSQILKLLSSQAEPPHVPYRNSKLTSVLKDALGGNSLCIMLVCVHTSLDTESETLNSLRYATSAKLVKNKPTKISAPNRVDKLADMIEDAAEDPRLVELYDFIVKHPDDSHAHLCKLLSMLGRPGSAGLMEVAMHPHVRIFCEKTRAMTDAMLIESQEVNGTWS